jgi:hypothetical protein
MRNNFAAISLSLLLLITIYPQSQSDDYGRPAGLIKIEIQPDEERLLSTPFEAFEPALNLVLSGQLTGARHPADADQIKIWDAAIQGFKSAFLADGTGDHEKDGK